MGPIKVEKFRATKSYKKKNLFVYNLVLHFLAALICSLLWSYPYRFPSLHSSMKHFCLISLPCIWSSFFNPKCLFVVVNVIVIFLVGESKLVSTSSSPSDDIYNEYIERSRSLRRSVSTSHDKSMTIKDEKVEDEKEVELIIKEVSSVENKQEEEEEKENHEKVETVEEEDEEKEKEGEEEAARVPLTLMKGEHKERRDKDEEEDELPIEELNKKVEEFIARVTKQWRLEVNS
ncbi:hypothetical protein SLE2022_232930 [Rubroshorea leprosula]